MGAVVISASGVASASSSCASGSVAFGWADVWILLDVIGNCCLKGVQHRQIIRGVAAALGAVHANLNVELLADVTLGLTIKGRKFQGRIQYNPMVRFHPTP